MMLSNYHYFIKVIIINYYQWLLFINFILIFIILLYFNLLYFIIIKLVNIFAIIVIKFMIFLVKAIFIIFNARFRI